MIQAPKHLYVAKGRTESRLTRNERTPYVFRRFLPSQVRHAPLNTAATLPPPTHTLPIWPKLHTATASLNTQACFWRWVTGVPITHAQKLAKLFHRPLAEVLVRGRQVLEAAPAIIVGPDTAECRAVSGRLWRLRWRRRRPFTVGLPLRSSRRRRTRAALQQRRGPRLTSLSGRHPHGNVVGDPGKFKCACADRV